MTSTLIPVPSVNFYPGKFGNLVRGDLVLVDPHRLSVLDVHAQQTGKTVGDDSPQPNVAVKVLTVLPYVINGHRTSFAQITGMVGYVVVRFIADPFAACSVHAA